jgi:hypothetical protein
MRALATAVLYFGTFLAIGIVSRRLLDRWMERRGSNLADVHDQAGSQRGRRRVFLLGFWRDEQ